MKITATIEKGIFLLILLVKKEAPMIPAEKRVKTPIKAVTLTSPSSPNTAGGEKTSLIIPQIKPTIAPSQKPLKYPARTTKTNVISAVCPKAVNASGNDTCKEVSKMI